MDVYQKVADEEGVSRQDVKHVTLGILYGTQDSKEDLTKAVRRQVQIAKKLGVIKTKQGEK